MEVLGLILGLFAIPFGYEIWACSDEKRMDKLEKERIKKIKQGTLTDSYKIIRLTSCGFPNRNFSIELKELILSGLRQKRYKLIDKKYCCSEIIAEYENFSVDKVYRILYELQSNNLIELVKLDFGDGVYFICAELKD